MSNEEIKLTETPEEKPSDAPVEIEAEVEADEFDFAALEDELLMTEDTEQIEDHADVAESILLEAFHPDPERVQPEISSSAKLFQKDASTSR